MRHNTSFTKAPIPSPLFGSVTWPLLSTVGAVLSKSMPDSTQTDLRAGISSQVTAHRCVHAPVQRDKLLLGIIFWDASDVYQETNEKWVSSCIYWQNSILQTIYKEMFNSKGNKRYSCTPNNSCIDDVHFKSNQWKIHARNPRGAN